MQDGGVAMHALVVAGPQQTRRCDELSTGRVLPTSLVATSAPLQGLTPQPPAELLMKLLL